MTYDQQYKIWQNYLIEMCVLKHQFTIFEKRVFEYNSCWSDEKGFHNVKSDNINTGFGTSNKYHKDFTLFRLVYLGKDHYIMTFEEFINKNIQEDYPNYPYKTKLEEWSRKFPQLLK